jgi:ketosteroid isomerase-like protein
MYNRISDNVDWNIYDGRLTARDDRREDSRPGGANGAAGAGAVDLRRALDLWIAATNQRNIQRQMDFYMPRLKAFYLTRDTSREAVRAEKNRAFRTARSIDIRADEPEIAFQDGGRTAVMRFRKSYRIVEPGRNRSGIVIQELRWQRTADGWRIFSERDVRVIR